MMLKDEGLQAIEGDVEGMEMFDFIVFRGALLDGGEGDAETGEEEEFAVWSGKVVDSAEAVLFGDIIRLDTGFLTDLARDGSERIGLGHGLSGVSRIGRGYSRGIGVRGGRVDGS